MKLYYLSNQRFPSERAYAIQIVSMCNAFAQNNIEVTLLATTIKSGIDEAPEKYYGTPLRFDVKKLQVPALMRFGKFGYSVQRLIFSIQALCALPSKNTQSIIYFRDEWIGWLISLWHGTNKLVWESHEGKYNFAARSLLRRGAKCVVISEGIRDKYLDYGLSAEKLLVAHDGIDESFFIDLPSRYEARSALGLPNDQRIAMYIGGFNEWKGVDTFFQASEHNEDILFVAIGGKPEQIKELKKQYPHVCFLGSKPYRDLKRHQQAADVLVLPNTAKNELSAKFTSPLKLFSYMSSGVPILTANLPSIRIVIEKNESVSWFTPDDSSDLVRNLKHLLKQYDNAALQAKLLQDRSKVYTWKKRAQRICRWLTNIHKETSAENWK